MHSVSMQCTQHLKQDVNLRFSIRYLSSNYPSFLMDPHTEPETTVLYHHLRVQLEFLKFSQFGSERVSTLAGRRQFPQVTGGVMRDAADHPRAYFDYSREI